MLHQTPSSRVHGRWLEQLALGMSVAHLVSIVNLGIAQRHKSQVMARLTWQLSWSLPKPTNNVIDLFQEISSHRRDIDQVLLSKNLLSG